MPYDIVFMYVAATKETRETRPMSWGRPVVVVVVIITGLIDIVVSYMALSPCVCRSLGTEVAFALVGVTIIVVLLQ